MRFTLEISGGLSSSYATRNYRKRRLIKTVNYCITTYNYSPNGIQKAVTNKKTVVLNQKQIFRANHDNSEVFKPCKESSPQSYTD